jgi:hypothetical protein
VVLLIRGLAASGALGSLSSFTSLILSVLQWGYIIFYHWDLVVPLLFSSGIPSVLGSMSATLRVPTSFDHLLQEAALQIFYLPSIDLLHSATITLGLLAVVLSCTILFSRKLLREVLGAVLYSVLLFSLWPKFLELLSYSLSQQYSKSIGLPSFAADKFLLLPLLLLIVMSAPFVLLSALVFISARRLQLIAFPNLLDYCLFDFVSVLFAAVVCDFLLFEPMEEAYRLTRPPHSLPLPGPLLWIHCSLTSAAAAWLGWQGLSAVSSVFRSPEWLAVLYLVSRAMRPR